LEAWVLLGKVIILWGKVLGAGADKISFSPQDALPRSDTFRKPDVIKEMVAEFGSDKVTSRYQENG
jgi:hypothetical protein